MKLMSMVDYVLKQRELPLKGQGNLLQKFFNYANFLSQPLEIGMESPFIETDGLQISRWVSMGFDNIEDLTISWPKELTLTPQTQKQIEL